MGWFSDRYGADAHPILSIDTFERIYNQFGVEAAESTVRDVQDGKVSEATILKYLDD